jgi:hypothetical protein
MRTARANMHKPSKASAGTTDQPIAEVRETSQMATSKDDAEKREAMIRIAAYTFYERRGFVSGHELEDWLEAEMEVDRQSAAAPKPTEAKRLPSLSNA